MKETVDHPAHYLGERNIETIDVIEDWDLDFSLGNALKYISRAGRKNPKKTIEDLKKSIWYIKRHKKNGKFGIFTIISYTVRKWVEEAYTVDEVLVDWGVSLNLEQAIKMMYESRTKDKDTRDYCLDVAIMYIESEIMMFS